MTSNVKMNFKTLASALDSVALLLLSLLLRRFAKVEVELFSTKFDLPFGLYLQAKRDFQLASYVCLSCLLI